jgi:hypothetical protein
MVSPQHPGMDVGPSDPDCPDLHLTAWLHVSRQETLPVEARFRYDRPSLSRCLSTSRTRLAEPSLGRCPENC